MKHRQSLHKPTPQRVKRRRTFYGLLLLGVGAAVVFANTPHEQLWRTPGNETPAIAARKPKTAPFTVHPDWPPQVVAAAIGAKDYGVLATYGDKQPRPIASVAKLITTLAILEKKPLQVDESGPSIPITSKDEQRYQDYFAQHGSVTAVKAGTPLTERQALEAMLLPSANNVADTAAVWAFGSMENYHRYANKMLTRAGLSDTKVGGDASGLDPQTVSTTRDLIRLGELALSHPVIAEITAMKYTSQLPIAGAEPNYNRLVTLHGYSGLKLGNSDEAGITLLFSVDETFKGKPITLIGVILGAPDGSQPQTQAYNLMESARKSLTPRSK